MKPTRIAVLLLTLVLVGAVAACSGPGEVLHHSGTDIVQVPLHWNNAYLVLGEVDGRPRAVLVDPGSPVEADFERLADALAQHELAWTDGSLIAVTHGHGDHAGGAARVADASGAEILAGAADLDRLRAGDGGELVTMGLEARMVRPFVPKTFPPVDPALALSAAPGPSSLDLRPYGIDATALMAPGHTEGSLVVRLASGEAIVGDLFRGGILGGRIDPGTPHRHYFHDDPERAEAAVGALLRAGVTRFYLGHGGPVGAAATRERFAGDARLRR